MVVVADTIEVVMGAVIIVVALYAHAGVGVADAIATTLIVRGAV